MLTYRRPAGSSSERAFIRRYILTLPGTVRLDEHGNYHVYIGEDWQIVWSAHLDTVHRRVGRQHVNYDGRYFSLGARTARRSNCLGADDTAGIFILCEMIRAGVPGHYVFHHAEEKGGIGSGAVTSCNPEYFTGARACIAFDRRGTSDIITHQCAGRCCSDVFAQSLADILNNAGMRYVPSDDGVFTDSANYTDLVGECTNVAVGYQHEHTVRETLDTWHLFALADAVIAADWSALTYARVPGEIDADEWHRYSHHPTVFTGNPLLYECDCCRMLFGMRDSDAGDWTRFCSFECEHEYALHLPEDASVYLDPEIARVQRFLRGEDGEV
jgi:hypothetical protein